MAIAIATEYPYSEAPSSDYPGGSFKNDTTGTAGDGTPLDKKWADDFLGFFQGLLSTAGLIASGASDTAVSSQYRDAMESIMWSAGDYKWCSYSTPGRRWLECNGQTVGNAASGATARANADTAALFAALWAEAAYAIQTGAGVVTVRGASAVADFAANKRMVLPDWRGDALRAWDHGRGVDSGRALGTEQMDGFKSHNHSLYLSAGDATSSGEGAGFGVAPIFGTPSIPGGSAVLNATALGATGGTETRMRNGSAMLVIRY